MRRNSKVCAIGGLIGVAMILVGFWFSPRPYLTHPKQLKSDMVKVIE